MSTKSNSTKSAASHSTHPTHAAHATHAASHTTEPVASAAADAPAATPSAATAAAATTATTKPASNTTVFVSPPPASANIPLPPEGYSPATPGEFKNVVPRAGELSALPQAIIDLHNFTDYAQVFGGAAPSLAEVLEAVTLGGQWSTMRATTQRWDAFCVVQEGLAWQALRLLLARLIPIYTVAVQANPKLASRFPGLTSLLGAKKSIAQKGVSTKRLNKQAKAEGKPPTHGVVGKRLQRKLAKEALAAANAALATSAANPPVTAAPVAAPAVTSPATTAVVAPAQAAVGAPAVVNGAMNGGAHS